MLHKTITIQEAINKYKQELLMVNIKSPKIDIEILLQFILKKTKTDLLSNKNIYLSISKLSTLNNCIKRRKKKEPISYITGIKEFYGLKLIVNPSVLIPRLSTENLVEKALVLNKNKKIIIDICAGSGCIALAATKNNQNIKSIATDISQKALFIAKKNTIKHNLKNRIIIKKSNLLKNITSNIKADLIITNPPYIMYKNKNNISSEILKYEPKIALFGKGKTGLKYHQRIILESKKFLKNKGFLLMEIGHNQHFLFKKLNYKGFYEKNKKNINNKNFIILQKINF